MSRSTINANKTNQPCNSTNSSNLNQLQQPVILSEAKDLSRQP
jgi:hypothetical protein